MDKNESIAALVTVIASQKPATVGVLSSMLIVTDPGYAIIGLIGSFISAVSHSYDVRKMRAQKALVDEECILVMWQEVVRAIIIGGLLTLIAFFSFTQLGDTLIAKYAGIDFEVKLFPSLYLALSLFLSMYAVRLFSKVGTRIDNA